MDLTLGLIFTSVVDSIGFHFLLNSEILKTGLFVFYWGQVWSLEDSKLQWKQVLFHIVDKVQEIIDAKSVFNEYTDCSRVYLQIRCHALNHQVCSFSQVIWPFEIPFFIFVNFRQNNLFYCRYEMKKYIFLENGVCSTEEQCGELDLYWWLKRKWSHFSRETKDILNNIKER